MFPFGKGISMNVDNNITAPLLNQVDLKVSVSAHALKEVLSALIGSAHTVHELMITRGLVGYNNPIDKLIDEFNTAIQKHTPLNQSNKVEAEVGIGNITYTADTPDKSNPSQKTNDLDDELTQ